MRRLWLATALAFATLTCAVATVARADIGAQDKVTAQALYDEGRRLMGEKKYADACARFMGSQRLDPAVGTLLNLAVCFEKNGQTASAWATFIEASALAKDAGQAEREKFARAEAAKLEPSLAKLTVVVPAGVVVDGLEIASDGKATPRVGWGLATPVDPGEHRIEARAPGKKAWSITVQVAAKEQRTVTVPPLEDLPAPAPPPSASVPAPSSAAPAPTPPPPATTIVHVYEPPPPPPATPGSAQRNWGVAAGIVGVVGVGASIFVGEVLAKKQYDKSNQSGLCNADNVCLPGGVSARQDAASLARVATYVFVGGAAFVVGGVVLYVTAPSAKPKTAGRVMLSPIVGPGAGGVSLRGAW